MRTKGHLGNAQTLETSVEAKRVFFDPVFQASEASMPAGAAVMNRPLTDQMEELKAKIALLGKKVNFGDHCRAYNFKLLQYLQMNV